MFMVQFVHERPTEFFATQSFGFQVKSEETYSLTYFHEILRFMRRVALLRDRQSVGAVIASICYLLPEFRAVVCQAALEDRIPVQWDIKKYGETPWNPYEKVAPLIVDKMLDTSLSDDDFLRWICKEMAKKYPFVSLRAVA